MQEPMNRRRFLELSATVTPLTEVGGALENFSPHLSELAFAAPTSWTNDCSNKNDCYDILVYGNTFDENMLLTHHILEPT